jgi:hypothetical protein
VLDLGRGHAFGDQGAFEAMVRMTDEEVKHQELFRRLEAMMAADMPAGYELTVDPNAPPGCATACAARNIACAASGQDGFAPAWFGAGRADMLEV